MHKIATKISEDSNIDNYTYQLIYINCRNLRILGLVKIFNQNFCFRPVVSNIGFSTYNLTSFISKLLNPIRIKLKYKKFVELASSQMRDHTFSIRLY